MTNDKSQDRPNILFLLADDHRHSAINVLGNEGVTTPQLDKLAAQGTAFTHAYIMGSTDVAVCMPSRGMLLTGRNLFAIDPPDLDDHPLWPQRLRESGYKTYGIGKWHNEPSSHARCFGGGDAIFFGGMSSHDKVPLWDFRPNGIYPRTPDSVGDGFSSTIFADAAINFLRNYDKTQPFCLYVAFTAPHDPRTPPHEYADLYDPDKLTLPDNFLSEHPFDNGEMNVRDEKLEPVPRTPEMIRQHLAAYYGMITHLDAEVGRILKSLAEAGLSRNTIVVYTADHGLSLGQHGLLGKQNLYDHSVRVPLLIRGPGISVGERRDTLCYMPDLYPTLCGFTHTEIQGKTDFRDLRPLLDDEHARHYDSVFAAYKDVQRMVRQERFKLIVYRINGSEKLQLFDMHEDPAEIRNLATDERYTDVLTALRLRLVAWQQTVDDPTPFSAEAKT